MSYKRIINVLPIANDEKLVLQRRIDKLKRDPKGFIVSSYKKRSEQVISKTPIKYSGKNNFTVVSAVYNVEKYLDDYFESLVNQSLSFKKHIQLIMIDDGSTDNSAEIIKKWQKKYPKNITYLYKSNGGQASARNMGIEFVNTEWVTFIDPDDFINVNYFYILNSILENDDSLSMVVANIQLFMEEYNDIRNRHPLRNRFKNIETKLPAMDLKSHINLSAAASIFKTSIINEKILQFGEDVKPTFEDGKFIAEYLLRNDGNVLFSKNLVYLYRKRNDKSSTVDKSWEDKRKYKDILEKGYLAVLSMYNNDLGYVPNHIQRTVLYDISWYLKLLLDNPEKTLFLSREEKDIFHKLIEDIFYYIDSKVILDFDLAGIWFAFKVGMIETFKEDRVFNQITYIENIDREKEQILISYFTGPQRTVSFQFDGKDVIPIYQKVIKHDFVGQNFVKEFRSWVSYSSIGKLEVFIDGNKSRISLKGKQYKNGVEVEEVIGKFSPSIQYKTDGSWLLMDRDIQADDNAEHMYRYLMHNHPKQNICFALRKDSHDWSRLELEGFNLVDFGSNDFEYRLRRASKIISSHLDKYINNYFGDEYEYSKKFIFLQHGVTKDNLSAWFNTKKNLQCIITTTKPEYRSLIEDCSYYKLTEKEVALTGFPRHDSLLRNNCEDSKIILIMPTWRQGIMGEVAGQGNTRVINEGFMETSYAQHWHNVLHNNRLEQLAKEYDYKIIFAPHANIEPYIALFNVPSYIEVWQSSIENTSMQQLFQQAKLMITDYSSVAFEIGLLNKMVLYYQFDHEEVFSGAHIYQKGYFSYENDGFGPVVIEEEVLLIELEKILANDGKPLEPYLTRMQDTFAYRDTNNCQRVYEAIMDLDSSEDYGVDVEILHDLTLSAYNNKVWDLVESRSHLLIQNGNEEQKIWAKNILNESLFYQNKFMELFESIDIQGTILEVQNYWRAKVAFTTTHWQQVIELLKTKHTLDDELMLMLLFSYSETSQVTEFDELKVKVQDLDLKPKQSMMMQAWSLCLYEEWEKLIQLLEVELPNFSNQELRDYLPQILIAKAYRHLSKFTEAHRQLADFESHTTNSSICRIEIARLAFARDNYGKCIGQYESTVNGYINLLPETAVWQYVMSHWNMGNIEELANILPDIIVTYPDNMEFNKLYIRVLTEQSKWIEVIEKFSKIELEQRAELIYPIILAKYRLGLIDEAYSDSVKPTIEHSYNYWSLIGEIALLVEDIELAKYCYKGMIAIYPEHDSPKNWIRFNSLKNNL
ncbi:CDP-glycerol:glycerophosphate glycerophosphotransferase [Psychrobacter sp. AOP7-B1-25]|uniref:CDP-glycerol:glycerophosphate glycerophosphotransferase n=1 Tax=Psychrobacter sp. AOP7-B1-25 TaxID=3457644 RepID=UPI00402BAD8C